MWEEINDLSSVTAFFSIDEATEEPQTVVVILLSYK